MAGLCEGGNEPSGSLKAICKQPTPTIGTTHLHPYHRQLHIAEPKSAVVQETLKTTTNSVETGRLSKSLMLAGSEFQSLGRAIVKEDEYEDVRWDGKEKGTRHAIGLLRTIGEKYLEKNKEVYMVFVDLEKAFDRVDWNKLMGILKKIGVYWKERRLFSNLYMKQRVKVRKGEEMSERGIQKDSIGKGSILEKELRKRLVKCFVWSVTLYGAETWTLGPSEEKRLEAFEMWIWRRMERVKWTDRIRNEAVLERVDEERMMLKLIRKKKRIGWVTDTMGMELEDEDEDDDDDDDVEVGFSYFI
ncbi:hypothetical protein ANN_20568 [Periplaneta americana]|uniref:Reverse transcriptase domain-containing protein n=1 Tax=Periplaneta americana TaxID=6978 RepID=A0ABQ8SDM6_PERAM|nr:hypothetical protein ANN_20568 [Periplaneta americana]